MPDPHDPTVAAPAEVRLADYQPPAFLVETVDLVFDLNPADTRIASRLTLRRNPAHGDTAAPLQLDGNNQPVIRLAIDGAESGRTATASRATS